MDYTKTIPVEILIDIFKHLSGSDLAAASQTCKRWYHAANKNCFLKKKTVRITNTLASGKPDMSTLKLFEKSKLPYPNYFLKKVEVDRMLILFHQVGVNIRELTLDRCEDDNLPIQWDRLCPNLEILKIKSCPKSIISGLLRNGGFISWLFGFNDAPILNNLKTLSLHDFNDNISDAVLISFVKAAPNLQELYISGCFSISDTNNRRIAECKLTFQVILELIVERAQNFKRLSFPAKLINNATLKSLSEVKNLNLDFLKIGSCSELAGDHFSVELTAGILALTTFQKNLRVLDIGWCSGVTDQSLISICHNLTNLEELNIQCCKAVTDLGLVKLTHLSKLRVLKISGLRSVTSDGITNGICRNVNRTLNYLDVSSNYYLDEHCIMNMSEKLPELRDLNVSYCDDGVTDAAIQAIFKNQKWLRFLDLRNCTRISDAGLTGLEKCDLVNQSKENKLPPYSSKQYSPPTSTLGCKAEIEIVTDAQRKWAVTQMSENISDDTLSLALLKGLRYLDLCGCRQITDVSLKYAFKLKELVTLDLKYCPKITDKGIEFLVRNCPSIEVLKLKYCHQINDEAIAIIAKGLRRLKELHLNGCKLLTDKSYEYIRTHCKCLQSLQKGDRDDFYKLSDSMAKHIKTLRKFD